MLSETVTIRKSLGRTSGEWGVVVGRAEAGGGEERGDEGLGAGVWVGGGLPWGEEAGKGVLEKGVGD